MHQVELLERAVPAKSPNRLRVFLVVAAVLVVVLLALVIALLRNWPFTRTAILTCLQQESGRSVEIKNFRNTYFPHPGAIAEGVTFASQDGPQAPPPISVERLTIQGSYLGLLSRHLPLVKAEGLRLRVPPVDQRSAAGNFTSSNSNISVGNFVADGAEIDFAPAHAGEQPLVFRLPRLTISSITANRAVYFKSTLLLPLPPAKVEVSGKFGPWKTGDAGQTPLSGSYTLSETDLGVFGGVAGLLSAKGKFDGVLQHINTTGETDVPDFTVSESGHKEDVSAQYKAVVNGLNGDVALQPATATFGKTTIVFDGSIEGKSDNPGQGKTVSLNFHSDRGRVQDLLQMFAKGNPPAMLGPINFRGQATVPPEDRPFLKKVRLQGDFAITGARYSDPEVQKNVDVASAKSRGEADKVEDRNDKDHNNSYDPGKVSSNVKSHVVLQNAVANLSNLTFDIPGASAQAAGTYELLTERVNLQGTVNLDTTLSKATTGAKSVLLKVMQPFVKQKKDHGSVVNLKVTGTYHKPNFSITPAAK